MKKTLQLLFFAFLFCSCEKKISDLEFEKNVMTEIFPSLIDSTCYDTRLFSIPPPIYGKRIYDKEGNFIAVDSTKGTKEQKQKNIEWKNRLEAIEKDTSKLIVAFDPNIKRITTIENDVKEDFERHFKGAKIYNSNIEADSIYIIDFKNIKIKNRFELKDRSTFPKGNREIWRTKYNFIFSGVVFFSGIQFDKDKKYGILNGGFMCNKLCGDGFRIYIKKIDNKWVIDKIENTWVS